jgi:heterodisulfide reductase subunit D
MTLSEIADEFDQCIKCGLCQAACPVCKELLLEKYTPRGKVQLARYYGKRELDLSDHCREIFARCLLCGSCSVACPSGVDLNKIFLEMRREIAATRGLHPAMEKAVRAVSSKGNIASENNLERSEWREGLKSVPGHLYERDQAKMVYFVGCVSSFFPMAQIVPQKFVQILDRAKVDFSILGGEEWCCGFPLLGAGAPERMKELIEHNLEKVHALGARDVVFSCPSCYRTWKEYYSTDLNLLHSTQFLEKMITEDAIPLREMKMTVTYHDPCDLGRNGGEFEAPRRILRAIPGLTLVEMESNRAKSSCCGGGGNVEMVDPGLSRAVAQKKIEEIRRTGADAVVTSCQQCVRTIKGMARRQRVDLLVLDVAEIVAMTMGA